jgi:uncharacterized membrane protein YccC
MIRAPAAPAGRAGAFLHTQLWPNPERVRAFLRIEVALLVSSFVAVTFKPQAAYWIVVYALLALSPVVGNSVRDALQRFMASVVGCAVSVLVIIIAVDEPALYRPLQAAIIGLALFIGRATPLGPAAQLAGTTFAIITGSDVGQAPEGLVTLSFYRILHAVIGSGIGAFVQLRFWSDDPLQVLRFSLDRQMNQVGDSLRGQHVVLDAARVGRHFELLGNAQVRHPEIVHRRAEIAEVILDVAAVVEAALREQVRPAPGGPPQALLDEARRAQQRMQDAELYKPPPPPPPAPPAPWWVALRESFLPARRAAIKTALAAFLAAMITQLLGLPSAGALFTALTLGLEVTSGSTTSKPLLLVGGVGLGFAAVMLVIKPWMPNINDPGSLLLLAAVAFAPTVWLGVGGSRVRNGGIFGTVVVSIALFQGFRPVVDLEATGRFALGLAIGPLVVAAVDRLLWPVDARRGMRERGALLMRDVAAIYREPDPRLVLAPQRQLRWRAYRHLVALIQLRSERLPLPGTPGFEPEEEALRMAVEGEHMVVARIVEARRELAGAVVTPEAKEARERVAAALEARARDILDSGRDILISHGAR